MAIIIQKIEATKHASKKIFNNSDILNLGLFIKIGGKNKGKITRDKHCCHIVVALDIFSEFKTLIPTIKKYMIGNKYVISSNLEKFLNFKLLQKDLLKREKNINPANK